MQASDSRGAGGSRLGAPIDTLYSSVGNLPGQSFGGAPPQQSANGVRRGLEQLNGVPQFALYESGASSVSAREPLFVPTLQEEKSAEVPSIKNVWFENLEEELPIISELLDKYPYIAMVIYSNLV